MRKEVYLIVILCSFIISYSYGQCQFSNLSTVPTACAGTQDGTLIANVVNATLPITFILSNNQGLSDTLFNQPASYDNSALIAGTYVLKAIDANNCMIEGTVTVNEPAPIIATAIVTDTECAGTATGTVTIVATGGTAPFLYSLSITGTPSGSPTFTNLPAGTYEAIVDDANGCAEFITFIVGDAPPILLDVTTLDNSCNGDATGAATVFANGGLGGYDYLWSNGAIGSTITGLIAGVYTVTVTDNVGCTAQTSAFVQEPSAIEVDFTVNNATCGTCDGAINVSVSGGTLPFFYSWSDASLNGVEDPAGLCSGLYTVTVTDNNGCTAVQTISVTGSSINDILVIEEVQEASCGICNGRIDLTISCGIPPYDITWSDPAYNGQTSLMDLCPGSYDVAITDTEGNQYFSAFEIVTPPPLEAITTFTASSCFGECSGDYSIMAAGGIPPYSFIHDGIPSTEPFVSDLCAGSYSVVVVDAEGCSITLDVDITEPAELTLNMMGQNVSCTQSGAAWVEVSGGTGTYIYFWSNNEPRDSIFNLQPGVYSLVVTDGNGCTASDSIFIDTPIAFDLTATPAGCDSTGGTATVELLSTVPNPDFQWSNGGSGATQSDLAPGGYSVTITDLDNGCTVHRNINVPLDTACFVRISGYVYNDEGNPDCVFDNTTQGLQNIMLRLDNGSITFTDADGYYEFKEEPGNYTVEIVLNTTQYEGLCIQPIAVSATMTGGNYPFNNFWVEPSGVKNMVLKVNKRNARPGFEQWVRICVMNYGSEPVDGTLTFNYDAIQEYDRATIPFTTHDPSTQTITWDFTDHPVGRTIVYTVYFDIPVNTPLGTPLSMNFRVDPIIGDITPDDNEIKCDMVVTGSFDPNDKQVIPSGEGDEGGISMQDSLLNYHIRFQNTGTDTAFTVVIRDTLDNNLDISTLVPGPSSHPYRLNVEKGNILVFTFDNIMLPDSFVNEPASNGFVFFDIEWKQGLEYGDMIQNTAAIYFDFNKPIITNTVTNTLRRPVGLFNPKPLDIQLLVSPNPTSDQAVLTYELETARQVSIQLYDSQGRHLRQLETTSLRRPGNHQLLIEGTGLNPGWYIISLEEEQAILGSIRMMITR